MIGHVIDFFQAYCFVVYLRMSDPKQNPRSPDQQLTVIRETLDKLGYEWVELKVYRDDAISGRYNHKRPQFQQMLRDIKSGAIKPDFILVDMLDRLGRIDEMPKIRSELARKHGVYVLTANTNFADPNTPQGRAHSMVESFIATEEGHIKAHRILRGKLDAVKRKRWPGGKPPFGYRIEWIMKSENGNYVPDYPIIVPDEATKWIARLHFTTVAETGWGTPRLAQFLDAHPDIPETYKPFHPQTLGNRLDDSIYRGELQWNVTCADIIDDQHIVEKKPQDEIIRVNDFCEAIVEPELWARVKEIRDRHRTAHPGRTSKEADGKLIRPIAPGLSLNYLLSGLLYCSVCGLRMTASSTSTYTPKGGGEKRYAAYICTRGSCANEIRIPEEWIREQVVKTILRRFFPFNSEFGQ